MKRYCDGSTKHRGAALLTAMLTVVLVASLASAMLWQQWRGVEIEAAQRTRVQSAWILTGALDWARLILREDARQGGADHLAEPWAIALAPARLSTFLAAQQGQTVVADSSEGVEEAFLSGHIEDLQARLNVSNLLVNGKPDEASVQTWKRLFEQLDLPPSELQQMTRRLELAFDTDAKTKAQAPLQPQTVSDLMWLGLSSHTLEVLRPFVTLLPVRTSVNLNTAAPEVLVACIPGFDMAQARSLVTSRASQHLTTLQDAEKRLANPVIQLDAVSHAIASRFFSVTGQLRVGSYTMQEQSVLQRDGMDVKTLRRTRETVSQLVPKTTTQMDTSNTLPNQ